MKTKLKQTNGITLIALIITIIILLILAMVSIRILMNEGIIKHAQNAANEYQRVRAEEIEKIDITQEHIAQYYKDDSDLEVLKKYFIGKKTNDLIKENGFIDDETTIGSGQKLKQLTGGIWAFDPNGAMYFWSYVTYNEKDCYRLSTDIYTSKITNVEYVYTPKGEEGKKYKHTVNGQEEEWICIYDNGDTVQLVSPNTIGQITLGTNDVDQAIYNYNNVIHILNKFCRDTLNDETARCIGSNPEDPDNDEAETYISDDLAIWYNGEYNNKGKKGNQIFEKDFVRMAYHGLIPSNEGYFIAAREVSSSGYVSFDSMFVMKDFGWIAGDWMLWSVSEKEVKGNEKPVGGVRAIVTVEK